METIWHILLTVCTNFTCLEQDIQWFDTKNECQEMLVQYVAIPTDGDWDTVTWECKPVGSISS